MFFNEVHSMWQNGAEIEVEVNTDFVEPGYSVSDDTDDDVSVSIDSNVDSNVLGSYTITYSATDKAGNSAEVIRTVIVVDTTAPVITLLNSEPLTLEQGTEYREYGAQAVDNYDDEVEVIISNFRYPGLSQQYMHTLRYCE